MIDVEYASPPESPKRKKFNKKMLSLLLTILLTIVILSQYLIPRPKNQKSSEKLINSPNITNNDELLQEIRNFSDQFVGKIDWFDEENLAAKIKSQNFDKCPLCLFNRSKNYQADSTKNDLILGFLYGYIPNNFFNLLRSIRTTGCNASVVIHITKFVNRSIGSSLIKQIEKCGIHFLIMPEVVRPENIHGNLLRHAFFAYFINKFKKDFNRILILDIYDTVFQKDPFAKDFPKDKVVFSYESVNFTKNKSNMGWLEKLDPDFKAMKYDGKFPLCSGLFVGTTNSMISFYNKYVNLSFWRWVAFKAQDQGVLINMKINLTCKS